LNERPSAERPSLLTESCGCRVARRQKHWDTAEHVQRCGAGPFQDPRNAGELPDATVTVEVSNPVCGDILQLAVRLEGGRIAEARFKTRADCDCLQLIAHGSDPRKTLHEVRGITATQISEALGGLPPACAWQPTRRRRPGKPSSPPWLDRPQRHRGKRPLLPCLCLRRCSILSQALPRARFSAWGSFRLPRRLFPVGTSSHSQPSAPRPLRAHRFGRCGKQLRVQRARENEGVTRLPLYVGSAMSLAARVEPLDDARDERGTD